MLSKSKFSAFAAILCGSLLLTGCGEKERDANHIKVGVGAGSERQLAEVAKAVAKEKYDLDVELVAFNDFVMPNEALNKGDLDANVIQHKPYLDAQMRDRGYKLAIVGKTFVFPIAAYSKNITSISELANGSKIAIPNDPTNRGRALLLLAKVGLIKLKSNVGLAPKPWDIIENKMNLQIIELEAPLLTRTLDDKQIAFAIINNTFASQVGLFAVKDGLFAEDADSPYVNIIVSREDNKYDKKVKEFVESYQSDEVLHKAEALYGSSVTKGW